MTGDALFETLDVLPVAPKTPAPDQINYELSDLDQGVPGNHTTPCVIYPLSEDGPSKTEIVKNLRLGLQNVLTHIPLVGGQLHTTASRISIRRNSHDPVRLHVHHLDSESDFPTYKGLVDDGFSPEFFTSNASRLTPPNSNLAGFRSDDGCPVAVFQANFIRGGLILTVALHHVCGDAKSIDHVFSLWAASTVAAAKGEPMPAWKPSLDRSYFSASSTPDAVETEQLKKNVRGFSFHAIGSEEAAGSMPSPSAAPETRMKMYHFTAASCAELKAACKPSGEGKFVSSYDCIAALTWRCMTRARVPYLKMDPQKMQTVYAHPVDSRGRFGESVPTEYFGNGFLMAVSKKFTAEALIGEGGMAKAAQAVRQSILDVEASSIPDLVKVKKGIEGRETMRWIWHPENVVGTSWTGMQTFKKYDFGFGLPVSLRLPIPPFEGVIGVLPANRVDGVSEGFDVYVVLEKGCQKRLEADVEYHSFCSTRGLVSK